MFGIEPAVLTGLVDVLVMHAVVRHWFGCIGEECFNKGMGGTQRGVKHFLGLDVERRGGCTGFDLSMILFVPGLFKVALLTQHLQIAGISCVATF